MPSNYRKNPALIAELRALIDDGILAGAEAMAEAVREKFAERNNGFIHGEFATGAAADIEVGPLYTQGGVRRADVFTAAFRDGEDGPAYYPAMWEFGHMNHFTQQYERVETFGPALAENRDHISGVMARMIGLGVASQHGQAVRRSGRINVGVKLRDWGL